MDMCINGKTPREILKIKSVREFLDWLPVSFAQVLILFAFSLIALAPLLVSIKAVKYFDPHFFISGEIGKYNIVWFYTYDYDNIMHKTVFPLVLLASVLAYLFAFFKRRTDGVPILLSQRKSPALMLFALLAVWVLFNVFLINGPTYYALKSALPTHENVAIYLIYYLCLFPMGMFIKNRKWKKGLLCSLVLISIVLVPFAFWFHAVVYTNDAVLLVFSNSNYYGIYLNVIISLCASMLVAETDKKLIALFGIGFIVNTIVLYFNNTMAAWVGVFFACLFSIIALCVRDRKISRRSLTVLALFLSCLIFCGFIDAAFISGKNNFKNNLVALFQDILNIQADPNSSSAGHAGSGRWAIWKYYFSIVKTHPWFGIGLDGVRALDIGQAIDQKRPHNEYLQYAAYLGIPGLLLYFSACLSVYIRAVRYRRYLDNLTLAALTAAFGYLVGAFFGNTVYNTTPYLYIMLGLGYVNTTLPDRCSGYEQA